MNKARTVIAVDDDPDSLSLVCQALEQGGFDCVPFEDPFEALKQILWFPPDAVLVDMRMPHMTGIDFCMQVAEHLGHEAPPLIMLSGADEEKDITQAFEAGASDYILKPFSISLLNAKLRNVLGDVTKARRFPAPDKPPKRIGPYTVLEELGRGGMGVVYKVINARFEHPVALKALWSVTLDIEDALRFRREIDVLLSLEHPNLVKVYDAGRSKQVFYYCMEFIAGKSVRHYMDRNGAFTSEDVTWITYCLADALHYVHKRDLVHRDIKPANILLSYERGPILTDFGLSKKLIDNQLTGTGKVVGTPHFMAPEMIRGDPVDHRADLFALGMVALEMLLGSFLIMETNPYDVMNRIATNDFPKATELMADTDCPPLLMKSLDRLLENDPADRFQDGAEFMRAIRPLINFSGGAARGKPRS